ncbi:hypothetical protein QWY14_16500, partial [Planococcus sp. N028]
CSNRLHGSRRNLLAAFGTHQQVLLTFCCSVFKVHVFSCLSDNFLILSHPLFNVNNEFRF